MSFGDYIRIAREARSLTLDQLATRTKIRRHLLADLEEDDLTRWPKFRVYRHGYMRSIADELGLDCDQVMDRFDEAFPEYAPVAFDGGRRPRRSPSSPPPPAPFLTPSATALAVGMGLVVGLTLTSVSRQMTDGASLAEADPAIGYAGQDIRLNPEAVDVTSAIAPSSDDEPVRVADNAGPAVVEGEVRVLSNPPDAFVTVNGIGRGRTPARIRYLPLGSYTIRVIQFGYKARESRVTLTADDPVRQVRVALRSSTDSDRRAASR
jgi:transcriptional regulator with XRE-family HTH domain